MEDQFHIDVGCQQIFCHNERICGDVFLSKKIKEEGRIIAVLSDGMGHGVKANILGTLTATFALNFTIEHKEKNRTAEIIINTLPECSERKTGYATFTVIDIELNGQTHILEYDNPQCIIVRGKKILEPEWTCLMINSKKSQSKEIKSCSIYPKKEDRIIFFTDGVSQSGLGSNVLTMGWGVNGAKQYIQNLINKEPNIAANKLATKVINEAYKNDVFKAKDDISCCVIYFREPRKLLLVSGPPFEEEKDKEFANLINEFAGTKIVCGGTTGDILARELNLAIEEGKDIDDPELPPISFIESIDLYTEGILTLSKVNRILQNYNSNIQLGKGPADLIARNLLDSDQISFLIGTRINVAHQDPNLPVELEIRRTVIRRIARLLEEKFLKVVEIKYL